MPHTHDYQHVKHFANSPIYGSIVKLCEVICTNFKSYHKNITKRKLCQSLTKTGNNQIQIHTEAYTHIYLHNQKSEVILCTKAKSFLCTHWRCMGEWEVLRHLWTSQHWQKVVCQLQAPAFHHKTSRVLGSIRRSFWNLVLIIRYVIHLFWKI